MFLLTKPTKLNKAIQNKNIKCFRIFFDVLKHAILLCLNNNRIVTTDFESQIDVEL